DAYVLMSGADGVHQLQRTSAVADREILGQQVHIAARPQSLELPFARVVKDGSGNTWDLILAGSWTIADARRFVTSYAINIVTPGAPLSRQMAHSWMANTIGDRVRDALRGQSAADLIENDALPARWWEKRLGEWLGGFGLDMKVAAIRWESADA